MPLFSPSLQAAFPVETLLVSKGHIRLEKPSLVPMFHWRGSHSALAETFRAARADQSPAGEKYRRECTGFIIDRSWSGVSEGNDLAMLDSVLSPDALHEFRAAVAKVHADRFLPGAARPATAGGAWIVPLVLASNPLPARIRERTKLPPLNLDIGVTVMARTNWRDVTKSLAPLAHAAWQYLQSGGTVSITAHYCSFFREPEPSTGAHGLILSVQVPLTSEASFASAISIQLHRCVALSLAGAFSPVQRDSLPLAYWHKPGLHMLNGIATEDAPLLQKMRITP